MAGDERNIFGTFLKRRCLDAHDIDAVVEVLTELAFGDELGEILVGGEDKARAQRGELAGAEAAELHLLQNAEQLDLGEEAEVADFVEEKRAAAGLLEVAFAGADGAGEGAFLVAEELGFDQGFRDGAAGDGDERRFWARLPRLWMARAMSSLPVPLSPVTRTAALRLVTLRMSS